MYLTLGGARYPIFCIVSGLPENCLLSVVRNVATRNNKWLPLRRCAGFQPNQFSAKFSAACDLEVVLSLESAPMSVSQRRQKIEEMLELEPQDIFLRYSLAMELSKDGQLPESLKLLQALCEAAPPYVPAFFRSAQLLADNDDVEGARGFLRVGIETAREQGDLHAAAEMGEMLADLGSL